MSIRKITQEQFSDGTTIDGVRIEHALDDLITRFNNVSHGDLRRRFTQSQIVCGFLPDTTAAKELPFLPSLNSAATTEATTPTAYDNVNRFKGIFTSEEITHKNVWTVSQYFKDPIIIVDITVFLQTDRSGGAAGSNIHTNTFLYGNTTYPKATPGLANEFVNDIDLLVSVDSIFAPEQRGNNTIALIRHGFSAEGYLFSTAAPSSGAPDMAQAYTGGLLNGLVIQMKDLNLPVHRDARVRWSLALPQWRASYDPWGSTPCDGQVYSMTLTFLEPLHG